MCSNVDSSLISNAISCQELNDLLRSASISNAEQIAAIQEADQVHSALSTSLIKTVKLGISHIMMATWSSSSSSHLTIQSSSKEIEIISVLNCIEQTLLSLQKADPNFYGEFRKEIPLKHLSWLSGYLTSLLDSDGSNNEEKAYSLEGDTSALITNTLGRIFWMKHFDRDLMEVSWDRFMSSFEEDYGVQPKRVVSILKQSFAKPLSSKGEKLHSLMIENMVIDQEIKDEPTCVNNKKASMVEEDEDKASSAAQVMFVVNIHTYAALTKFELDGLYGIYQKLCDPVTVVYEMGSVEDNINKAVFKPTIIGGLLGLSVSQICCGGQHAAVLTHEGSVHTWGRGGFGRLGHGKADTVEYPREVLALRDHKCVQIACGFAYTAAVTDKGLLFCWGAGENGRLGLGDTEDRNVPTLVDYLLYNPVHRVYAGSVHTCVLTREGQVYSFGKYEYTGHGSEGPDVLSPRVLDAFGDKTVTQISVGPGGYHTIALTSDFEVFTWGHNRVGQLGYSNGNTTERNGEGAYFIPQPTMVPNMKSLEVKQVVAGWGHTAVLTSSGQVMICGRNLQGQLGLGDPSTFPVNERDHPYQDHFVPISTLSHTKIKQIACGGEHSVALGYDNSVYTFGAGNKGQLGHVTPTETGTTVGGDDVAAHGVGQYPMSEYYPKLVRSVKQSKRDIQEVACGNNCTLILAGRFNPPSLLQRCVEVIYTTPELASQIDNLPTEVSALIKRHHSDW